VQVVAAKPPYTFKNRTFLTFEKVSLVPIQTKMLVPEMLTEKEVSAAVNGIRLMQNSHGSPYHIVSGIDPKILAGSSFDY
jgi:hypothetical protein